jgi:DNA repair exonuclease SbcCD ATPase subunit
MKMAQYLYTRELQERLEELEGLESELRDLEQELADATDQDEIFNLRRRIYEFNYTEEEQAELRELRDLKDEISREWDADETLIPESEWIDYVRDLAEDIGAVGKNSDWVVIDWEATAKNMAQDYNTVTYQGEDYYVRYS